MMEKYLKIINSTLEQIKDTQGENIHAAAEVFAETIKKDGLIHLFGTGHSHMIALEGYSRAGGLAVINPILEENLMLHHGAIKSGSLERLSGYAAAIIALNDIKRRDCLVVISNSGRNAVPVEMALEIRKRNIPCIAITSLAHSRASLSRHSSGKRLFEAADIIIDNCGPNGDASLEIPGLPTAIAPLSTITGAFIIHSITAIAIESLLAQGITPPVFISGNASGSELHNYEILEKYKHRIRF